MFSRFPSILSDIGVLGIIVGAIVFLVLIIPGSAVPRVSVATTTSQIASGNAGLALGVQPTSTTAKKSVKKAVTIASTSRAATAQKAEPKKPLANDEVVRIQDPYTFPPVSFATINDDTRAALVNILCMPHGGALSPISGSGVVIDPRGVILTNAHVAQYVLLSESPQIDLSCVIRAGSPASPRYRAIVLYIPPIWVQDHAPEIRTPKPLGTGEHDYALLLITDSVDGSTLPASFPSLTVDTREAIGFQGDQVLVASYPAEFVGGIGTQYGLYSASSVTAISKLLTFSTRTVDLISLGGVIEAQSGSSGGAVVNAWDRLIGIVTTTSEGDTTSARDLRAVTLSYISRDLAAQSQFDLEAILGGDVAAQALDFNTRVASKLIKLFVDQLAH